MSRSISFTVILVVVFAMLAMAQESREISYQGQLTDNLGEPVNGPVSMTFRIFSEASGGTAKWTESQTVTVNNGLFNAMLGSLNPIPLDSLSNPDLGDFYLEIQVGTDSPISPRTLLGASPYAAVTQRIRGDFESGPGELKLFRPTDVLGVWLRADSDGSSEISLNANDTTLGRWFTDQAFDGWWGGIAFEVNGNWKSYGSDGVTMIDEMGDTAMQLNSDAINFRAAGEGVTWRYGQDGMEISGPLDTVYLGPVPFDTNYFGLGLGTAWLEATVHAAGHVWPGIHAESRYGTYAATFGQDAFDDDVLVRNDLEVSGNLDVAGSAEFGNNYHTLIHQDGNAIYFDRAGTSYIIAEDETASICLRTGSTERYDLVIQSDGDVGIGTPSPSTELHVVGSICYTGSIGACSDARYKRDVETIDKALKTVLQMRGVSYNWKRSEYPDQKFDDQQHIGFIAQEIKDIIPSVVTTDDRGYMSVDYSRVTPLLVEAVKDLKAENDELKAQMNHLMSLVESIIAQQDGSNSDSPAITGELPN